MIAAKETTSNSRQAGKSSRPSVGGLLNDLISLGELQGRLLLQDIADVRSGSAVPVLMLIGGFVLALATAPVLLLGLGWLLAEFTSLPIWGAMLTSAVVFGIIPAGLLLGLGGKTLKARASVLQRSTAELKENTRWLKHRIKSSF